MHSKIFPIVTPGLEAPQTTQRYIPVSFDSSYSYTPGYDVDNKPIKTFSVLDQIKGRKTAEQKELVDLLYSYTNKGIVY